MSGTGGAAGGAGLGVGGSSSEGTGGASGEGGRLRLDGGAATGGVTGGGTGGVTGGGTGGMTGGGTGGLVGGTTGSCASDLSGTWDLVATSEHGTTSPGVLIISHDTFSLTVSTQRSWASSPSIKQLTYSAAGNQALTWSRTDDPMVPITVQNTPTDLSAGSIPLALGGQWAFAANGMRCSAALGANSTVLCQSDATASMVGGVWPFGIPKPRLGTTYTVVRTGQLESQFGFVGGQWRATASSSSEDVCTMTVAGATVSITCKTSNSLDGSMQMTVGSGCVASGTTSSGWELSARRR